MRTLRIDVLCLLPGIIEAAVSDGIVGRAVAAGRSAVACTNPRDFAGNPHGHIDDRPYGGGPGMVMRYGPLARAHDAVRGAGRQARTIALSPQGALFTQARAKAAAESDEDLILVAGRYEGIDERFLELRVDEQWSIGDYVLSGGELAAAVAIDAICRRVPGVLGCAQSAAQDSFADGLLDCPHYTRPEEVAGRAVPEALLSGDHARIARWRRRAALLRTARLRPDLLARARLSAEDAALLEEGGGES